MIRKRNALHNNSIKGPDSRPLTSGSHNAKKAHILLLQTEKISQNNFFFFFFFGTAVNNCEYNVFHIKKVSPSVMRTGEGGEKKKKKNGSSLFEFDNVEQWRRVKSIKDTLMDFNGPELDWKMAIPRVLPPQDAGAYLNEDRDNQQNDNSQGRLVFFFLMVDQKNVVQ